MWGKIHKFTFVTSVPPGYLLWPNDYKYLITDAWHQELFFICEEAGERIILKKDKEGRVIGIEKLYVVKTLGIEQPLPVEVVVA